MSGPARRLLGRAALAAAVAAAAALGVWTRLEAVRPPVEVAPFYRTAAGEPLFYTADAFYHLRLARELAATGRRGDRLVDGRPWDGKSFAPAGRPVHASLLQDLEVWVWKLWPGEVSLAAVAFQLPAALSALSVLLAFWIGRRLAGDAGGLAAALLTAVQPELVSHTHAGMADTPALRLVLLALAAGAGLALAQALWRRAGTPRRRALLAAIALALAAAAAVGFAVSPTGRKLARYLDPGAVGVFPDAALQVQELAALAPAQVIARLGGWPVLALAAAGLVWLAARAPRPAGPLGALLLAAWALPAIAVGAQAMRFLVYAVPAVALAAGCALAALAGALIARRRADAPRPETHAAAAGSASRDGLSPGAQAGGDPGQGTAAQDGDSSVVGVGGDPGRLEALRREGFSSGARPTGAPGRRAAAVAIAAAAALALAWSWRARIEGFDARRPAADLALAEAAAAIAARAPADALVYSWWDHGHALAALAGRGVVLDGATFQTQRLYWLALALTTHDETLAANALRLIGCAGEETLYADLVDGGLPPAVAVERMRRALRSSEPEAAAAFLRRAGAAETGVEEARRLLACRPPPSWLVVTGDLTAKTTSWSWFGNWRFDGPNRRPGPRMSAPVRCALSPEGRLECADGTAADLARDGFEDRSTPGHFAAAGPPGPDRRAPVLHQHGDGLLLTWVRPWIVDSLFSRLYFFNGRGLERFRLEGVFHHPPHTQRVLVYRILWDASAGGGDLTRSPEADHGHVPVGGGQTIEIAGIGREHEPAAQLDGGGHRVRVGQVLRARVRRRQHAADEPRERAIGRAHQDPRLAGEAGIDRVAVVGAPVQLGEDHRRDHDDAVQAFRDTEGGEHLECAPSGPAGERTQRAGVEDDTAIHARSCMYFAISASSGEPCSRSSWSSSSPSNRRRRR